MSIEPAVSGLASLIGPLALLLVVIRTIMVGRAAVTASPLWLATIALGLVTLIAWLVPVGLASIWTFLAPSQPLVDASFRPFVAIGLPVMMTSLSLAVVLASASPPEGASHRVLAVILGVVVSGAWVARWLVLDADVEDSYATVGLSHVLLVAPVAAYFYHARLPRHPTRRMQWGTALGFAPLVAVGVAEVMLGLSGMPRRYSTYDTTFTAWHLVATSAWLAFFVHLAIWHFAVSRARRLEVTIEDLA